MTNNLAHVHTGDAWPLPFLYQDERGGSEQERERERERGREGRHGVRSVARERMRSSVVRLIQSVGGN